MTTITPKSLRFSLEEVLAGMLATLEGDHFSDDTAALAASFETLASQFTLFAPFAGAVAPDAVGKAFGSLEAKSHLGREPGKYVLTAEGRVHCISTKRTLFNRADCEQLEAATHIFQA